MLNLLLLLTLVPLTVHANTSGGGLTDYVGNGITSTTSGSKQPLDTGVIFGGALVDPRARTWTLSSGTDTVAAAQSGAWTMGRTWSLASGTDSISAVQSGTWTVQQGTPPWSVSQSGTWTTGRTWTLASGTDSITSIQGTSPWVNNISQFGGSNVVTGIGAGGSGIPRVSLSNDSKVIAWDGTTNTTVKAASTAPASTDTSLVVGLNPNGNQATASNQTTLGNQTTKVNDGTNTMAVKAASTAPLATDPSAVVVVSPNGNQATAALQTSGNSSLTSIQSTSNSTAVNTAAIQANQTNGSQRTLVTDLVGNLQPSGDAPARTLFARLNDGTTSSTVKAASTQAALTDTALVVTERPDNVGTPTQTSVSCAATSTTLLAASTATMFLSIRNPTSATQTIWINVAGAAAVAAPPSLDLAPGAEADFFAEGSSFLPTAQINCISAGTSSSVSVVYK